MALTREEVEHIAELAKISLTNEEVELFREQLGEILEFGARLERLDTNAISPTATVIPLCNVMRADQVEPSLPQEDALANAPAQADGYFQVEAILEEPE